MPILFVALIIDHRLSVVHSAALVACHELPLLARGDTYMQVEWVLLESHSELLQLLLVNRKENARLIVQRCRYLSALIHNCTIPENARILDLKKQVGPVSWSEVVTD